MRRTVVLKVVGLSPDTFRHLSDLAEPGKLRSSQGPFMHQNLAYMRSLQALEHYILSSGCQDDSAESGNLQGFKRATI